MGFTLDVSISAVTVFLQGLLSFFSPCVLPLLPLYIGYLSGGTGVRGEDGKIHYHRGKVMVHTVFFVTGVSFAFFLLGLGVSAVGGFFHSYQAMFARTGGILVMLFGLYQMGIFGISSVLGKEHRLPFRLDRFAMSPVTALLMGFTFSFAWTPCVGPALTSVLLMAASAATKAQGFVLIGVYTMGFVLPFLFVGLFTTQLLELFKKCRGVVQYTVKIGGILMVAMGLMMFTGKMNDITGYLSRVTAGTEQSGEVPKMPGEDGTEDGGAAKENAAVDKAIENAQMEIPDAMLNTQVRQMLDDFSRRMQSQGLTMEQYFQFTGMTLEKMQEEMKPQALKRIQTRLVLEKIAEVENIQPTDEEVEEEFKKMADAYKMEVEKIKELLGDRELEQMKKDMAVQKAVTLVADEAKEA